MVSEGLGAAKRVQQHVNHGQKRMGKITQKPQNHCPRSVRASPTSAKNRTSAHCLPASWNERSCSRLKRFMQWSSFSFFWFLKNVVKPLRSRTRASVSKIMSATNRQANRCHRKLRFGVTPVMVLATRTNPAKGHGSRRRSGVTFVGVFLINRLILG